MDRERDEAKAKSALTPSSSTQDKVADSVRDNTPSTATTPVVSTETDTFGSRATQVDNNTITPNNLSSTSDVNSSTVDINHISTDDSDIDGPNNLR